MVNILFISPTYSRCNIAGNSTCDAGWEMKMSVCLCVDDGEWRGFNSITGNGGLGA